MVQLHSAWFICGIWLTDDTTISISVEDDGRASVQRRLKEKMQGRWSSLKRLLRTPTSQLYSSAASRWSGGIHG